MTSLLPLRFDSPARIPARLHGYLSVNSKGGTSVFDAETIPAKTDEFRGSKQDANRAIKVAENSGLEVIAQSRLGLAVVGPASAYEELTGGKVVTQELLVYAEAATRRYVTHVDITGKNQPEELGCGVPKSKNSGIEAVILERPRAPQASVAVPAPPVLRAPQGGGIWPSPIPPNAAGFYLRVPQDVALGLGAPDAQRRGFRGQGVTVAMVDTGFYLHPFFPAHHYQIATPIVVVPGADQGSDPVGHGTGESANIFANAPDAQLQPIRASNDAGELVAAVAGS
jgi:hypothetical protein